MLERWPLIVQGDSRSFGQRQLAGLQLRPARDRLQKRRLAGPVRARQRHPLPSLERKEDAFEEKRPSELLT